VFNLISIPWTSFLPPLVLTIIISWLLIAVVRFLAIKFKLYGHWAAHQDHRPIARWGGVAIWLTFILSFIYFIDLTPPRIGLLIGLSLMFAMGLVDDSYNLSAYLKLFWQLAAVIVAVSFGIHIGQITNPLGGIIILPIAWDYILSVLWLLIVVNALNMLDGLDGLAAGTVSIFSVILFILSLFVIVNQPSTAMMAILLLGTMIGFLLWNWHPAKIFMGDAGSNMLGFIVGTLAIISGAKLATVALVLGFPLLDLAWATWRRLKQGHSPFVADREHLHHRLLDARVSHRNVVFIILMVSAVFGVVSLLSGTWAKLIALVGVAILMIILIRTVFFMQSRKIVDK